MVSHSDYARLHSMKLGSYYKINREMVSDHLWASALVTGKSKIPSLPLRQGFSTSALHFVGDNSLCPQEGTVLGVARYFAASSGLYPLDANSTKPPPPPHTLLAAKYVSRHCQTSHGDKILPLFENHCPEGSNCPVNVMILKNSKDKCT